MEKEQIQNKETEAENETSKKSVEEENKAYLKASGLAYLIAIGITALFEVVYSCIGEFHLEFVLLFSAITGAYNLVLGISKVKNYKIFLTCGILLIIVAVAMAVLWILELAGIA